jgi:hypothetical protein
MEGDPSLKFVNEDPENEGWIYRDENSMPADVSCDRPVRLIKFNGWGDGEPKPWPRVGTEHWLRLKRWMTVER